MSEFRQAARSLLAAPWYTLTVVAVMALTLALSTTVFAVVDGVLFKPLPYARPAELHMMNGGYQGNRQRGGISVAPRNIRDWTAAVPGAVSTILPTGLGYHPFGDVRGWAPIVGEIDAQFFHVLGTTPLVGGFAPEDFASSAPTRVLISYELWQSQFGGRTDVVGQRLPAADTLPADRGFTVAGVLRRDFLYPWFAEQPALLKPIDIDPARNNDLRYRQFTGIVRLPPNESIASVEARMDAAAVAEAVDWIPRPSDGSPVFDHASLVRLDERLSRLERTRFGLVTGAAAVLLLLGCLNISGLMSGRLLHRQGELHIRRALGAGASDIARGLLMEQAIVVSTGAAIGLAIAAPLTRITVSLMPADSTLLKAPVIDWRVAAIAATAGLVAIVISSAAPLWKAIRVPVLHGSGDRVIERSRSLGRSAIVGAQIAVALVLTVGGTLLVGSLIQVWRVDPGFAADQVILLQGRASGSTLREHDAALDRFELAVRGIPGVIAVGSTQASFAAGIQMNAFMDGATVGVRPGFDASLGIWLEEGRWLTNDEIRDGVAVAVVSRRVATRLGRGRPVVGESVRGFIDRQPHPFTIVGVASDLQMTSWDRESTGQIFAPYLLVSTEQASVSVAIRSRRPEQTLAALLPLLRRPEYASNVRTTSASIGDALLNDTIRPRRLNSWVFGSFMVAALVIVGVGILGLMAMQASRRTREFGVRIALGSTPRAVTGLLIREQFPAVAAGLAAGAMLAIWSIRFVRAFLFHLDGGNPLVWVTAVSVILLVTLTGAAIPAIRAGRVDPARTLRTE